MSEQMRGMDSPTPKRLTAMHHLHIAAGAVMVEEAGWSRPARYADPEAERARLHASVGVCDVSPLLKVSVQGDGLETSLPELEGVAPGRLVRGTGGDIAARLAPDEAVVISPPAPSGADASSMLAADGAGVHAIDVTSGMAGAAVIGPAAERALAGLTDLDISGRAFPDMACAQARFAEVYGLLLRLDRDGLPAYQLYFSRDFGQYVWEALVETAHHLGGGPVGIEALG